MCLCYDTFLSVISSGILIDQLDLEPMLTSLVINTHKLWNVGRLLKLLEPWFPHLLSEDDNTHTRVLLGQD